MDNNNIFKRQTVVVQILFVTAKHFNQNPR